MKRRKVIKGTKVIPLRKPDKEIDFKERIEKFERYYKNPKEFHKIFTELGFNYVDDNCDGYCPECEEKDSCETYLEIKDDFEEDETNKPKK